MDSGILMIQDSILVCWFALLTLELQENLFQVARRSRMRVNAAWPGSLNAFCFGQRSSQPVESDTWGIEKETSMMQIVGEERYSSTI
jgi:hypothetical protein